MSTVTFTIEADFDRNGSYETDLTPYVEMPGSGCSISRGMGSDGVYRISSVSIDLSNKDGTFSPDNSASSLYGRLEPKVPIRIKGLHNAVTYVLWTGYIKSYKVGWRVGQVPMCRLECDDIAAYLQGYAPLNVTVASRTSSAALTAIFAAMGLAAPNYNLATGQQTFPYHWARNQNALTAAMDVVRSEMGGYLWPDADGVLQFEARNTRLSVTPDWTWGDGTVIFPYAIDYDLNDQDLISSATVQAQILVADVPATVIFGFSRNAENEATSMSLAAGATYGPVELDYAAPVTSPVTPVATTDYTAHSAADGTGTDMTANLSVTFVDLGAGFRLTLKNTHSSTTLYVTKFEVRALPATLVTDRPQFITTKAISGQLVDQGISVFLPFADDAGTPPKIQDYSAQLAFAYRYPYPRITLHFHAAHSVAASDTTKKDQLLAVEIGDRVKYKDTGLGASLVADGIASGMIDDWFYVEQLKYTIPPNWAGASFDMSVTLIPTYLYRNLDKMAYDFFTRADVVGDLGTSTSGDVWSADGNMDISSNAARANSDVLQMPVLALGTGATDQIIDASLSAITTGDEVGVVFRHADASNQYRAYVDFATQEVILEKNVATVVTEIISPAMTVGAAHEMRVIIQSTRIRVWVDRKLMIDTTDSGLSAGTNAGLFLRTANATAKVDDFVASSLL